VRYALTGIWSREAYSDPNHQGILTQSSPIVIAQTLPGIIVSIQATNFV
jgi:hypothetical protein